MGQKSAKNVTLFEFSLCLWTNLWSMVAYGSNQSGRLGVMARARARHDFSSIQQ